MARFVVVRVNRDPTDTYASPIDGEGVMAIQDALNDALAMAGANDGAHAEWGVVEARDAGSARLIPVQAWRIGDRRIERAFQRAGLTVAGKPFGARGPRGFDRVILEHGAPVAQFGSRLVPFTMPEIAYAWFSRQVERGATGAEIVTGGGGLIDAGDAGFWKASVGYREDIPEGRVGFDLWVLGRKLAKSVEDWWTREVIARGKPARDGRDVVGKIIDAIRAHLNWPRLPDGYDPPPPSSWPADEFAETVEPYSLKPYDAPLLREPVDCGTAAKGGPYRWADISLCLRRQASPKRRPALSEAHDVAAFVVASMPELAQEAREHVLVVPVDVRLRGLGIAHISTGTLAASIVHPREVAQILSALPAHGFFLLHNHPSGDSALSPEDRAVADRMRALGDVLGIRFLDMLALAPQPDGSWEFSGSSGSVGVVASAKGVVVREPETPPDKRGVCVVCGKAATGPRAWKCWEHATASSGVETMPACPTCKAAAGNPCINAPATTPGTHVKRLDLWRAVVRETETHFPAIDKSILDVAWFLQDAVVPRQTRWFYRALADAIRSGEPQRVSARAPLVVSGVSLFPHWEDPDRPAVMVEHPKKGRLFDIAPSAIEEFRAVVNAFGKDEERVLDVLWGSGPGQDPRARADFDRAVRAEDVVREPSVDHRARCSVCGKVGSSSKLRRHEAACRRAGGCRHSPSNSEREMAERIERVRGVG